MALQSKTFSLGDFAWGSSSNAYVLDLILTEESVSQESNTSFVSYVLQLRSGSQNRFQATIASSLSLNGVAVSSGEANKYLDYNSTWKLLSGSTTVKHNDDGTLDMSFSASISTPYSNNQYYPPDLVLSGTWTLTTIDRETTITASSANIEDTATINLNRKNSSYTHSIAYQFGTLSGYINASGDSVSSEVKISNESLGFKIPAIFYSQIPKAKRDTCYLTCRTYSGTTQIGKETTAEFVATAAEYRCAPNVNGTVIDTNNKTIALTGNEKILIHGCSTAFCTIQAEAKNSASIEKKTIGGVQVSGNTRTIENVEVSDILFRAEDSRGYTSEDQDENVKLIPYTKLTNDAWASRPDAENNVTLHFSGNFYKGGFGKQDNSLTLEYLIEGAEEYVSVEPTIKNDNTYVAEVVIPNMDYTRSHRINVKVTDKLSTVEIPVDTGKSIPVFNWGEDFFRFNVPVGYAQSVSGLYLRSVQVYGSSQFRLQTRFSAFDGTGNSRQSILLFGYNNSTLLYGVVGVRDNGECAWSGNVSTVTVETADNIGGITVTLPAMSWDWFGLISAEFIEEVT